MTCPRGMEVARKTRYLQRRMMAHESTRRPVTPPYLKGGAYHGHKVEIVLVRFCTAATTTGDNVQWIAEEATPSKEDQQSMLPQ